MCLGRQHSLLFHRKINNDSNMGNALKSLNGLVAAIALAPRGTGCSAFGV